jgi:hypothetical protein
MHLLSLLIPGLGMGAGAAVQTPRAKLYTAGARASSFTPGRSPATYQATTQPQTFQPRQT